MRGSIPDASRITGVPSGTIRRWLSEGRLTRHGDHKPYRVDYDEVVALRKLLMGMSDCRVYWGHAGCALERGHTGEHADEHGRHPYPGHMFGIDATPEERAELEQG